MNSNHKSPALAREEIIRQLEAFPVEVLEAALLVLQMRESAANE